MIVSLHLFCLRMFTILVLRIFLKSCSHRRGAWERLLRTITDWQPNEWAEKHVVRSKSVKVPTLVFAHARIQTRTGRHTHAHTNPKYSSVLRAYFYPRTHACTRFQTKELPEKLWQYDLMQACTMRVYYIKVSHIATHERFLIVT